MKVNLKLDNINHAIHLKGGQANRSTLRRRYVGDMSVLLIYDLEVKLYIIMPEADDTSTQRGVGKSPIL